MSEPTKPEDVVIYERAYLASAAEDLPFTMANWSARRVADYLERLARHAHKLADAEAAIQRAQGRV